LIPNQLIQHTESALHVPWGNWRSVDHSMHGFFIESFIDELAHLQNEDPFEYRASLLAHEPRFLKVLNKAAEKSSWHQSLLENWGRGIAIHQSFGTIVAEVVEVQIIEGKIHIERVVCVADAGFAMHRDAFIAQMESGIIYGLTAALYGEITIKNGAVEQHNFHDHKMLRMDETPIIETYIINSHEKIGGASEPSTSVIAPALVNAIFNATGKRIRTLPIQNFDLSS
jgi:isoquinoline 1-oxidoreductase beta subunit